MICEEFFLPFKSCLACLFYSCSLIYVTDVQPIRFFYSFLLIFLVSLLKYTAIVICR